MLSIFALLLLMGAAAVPEQPAALLAEEESAGLQDGHCPAVPADLGCGVQLAGDGGQGHKGAARFRTAAASTIRMICSGCPG